MTQSDFNELVSMVFQMREAQQKYFKNRTQTNLNEAKRKEVWVDEALKKWGVPAKPIIQQSNLFNNEKEKN